MEEKEKIIREFLTTLINNCAIHHGAGCACYNNCGMAGFCHDFLSYKNIDKMIEAYNNIKENHLHEQIMLKQIQNKGYTEAEIEKAIELLKQINDRD